MMERRRALKIPFTVDKDNLMDNPFRIPMTNVLSKCGKHEKKVSWTEFAGRSRKYCDSPNKNGSTLFHHTHVAKVRLEMTRRKPCVILTDILKTKKGKSYLERLKQNHTLGDRGQVSSLRREHVQHEEESVICRDRKSSQRVAYNDKNKNGTPKGNPKTTLSSSQRLQLRSRYQSSDDKAEKEGKDISVVSLVKDHGEDFKFAEVVDCGFSVSWEPAEDTGSHGEFSAPGITDQWTDPDKDVLHSLKRKKKDAGSPCNGTSSPKRHRESVLRLSGEDRKGQPAVAHICLEEGGEDGDLENLEHGIVQFTVGTDDPPDLLVKVISPNLEDRDLTDTPRQSPSPSRDNTTKTSPSEPIVLSSDDEDSCNFSQHCSPAAQTLVTVEDAVIKGQSPQEAKQQEGLDMEGMQLLHVVLEDLHVGAVSLIPSVDYSCMSVAFSTLHCGAYHGKSNGDIMIADQNIIIRIKDTSGHLEGMLTFERKELQRYSLWEQQEMEAQELHFRCDEEPPPPAVLLLHVSQSAAAVVQQELLKLCVEQDETTNTAGKVSPFLLLTLRDPLEGMEGALFRSLLDIDCLNSLAAAESIAPHDEGGDNYLEDFHTPVLSLTESIELIKRTGLDSHLLSLLGLEETDPRLSLDECGLFSDADESSTPPLQPESDSDKGTMLEVGAEKDMGAWLKPEEDMEEEGLVPPSEEDTEEPSPFYTLCHRRSKGSYSVSLCKPDSSWTKYRHQGLAHRLIQFPPPPLKGGITVTMEDLQCLDSGQFLNDVIIDFYLKYLLHKASAAVTERSHIFSSFFYKQLTRRDNASEGSTKDACQRQRRHQRVKTWTRHVDIFKKDFLFVPVNQEAHWYLVVICFPGLEESKSEAWSGPNAEAGKSHSLNGESQEPEVAQGSKSPSDDAESPPMLNPSDDTDTETENTKDESLKDSRPGPVSCTEKTCQKRTVWKRPCILVMDSLKRSLHERVFKLLRDYLESEWEVRRGSSRDFSADQMQSSHCNVPLQDNSSDCGLYLLQYVESFLKDPVVHFDLPLRLERWFPRQQVRRKRDEIRDLVLNLYRHQNLDSNGHAKQRCC